MSVLGEHSATVDGRTLRRADWTSKKAFEVLTVLAAADGDGIRREQLFQRLFLSRRVIGVRTNHLRHNADFRGGAEEASPRGLPVWQVSVRGHQVIDLRLAEVRATAAGESENHEGKGEQTYRALIAEHSRYFS